MLAVTSPEPGVVEVNYMWMPSWIGLNSNLLNEMGHAVRDAVIGRTLQEAEQLGHQAVLDFLAERYPEIQGLREYLEALRSVRLVSVDGQKEH